MGMNAAAVARIATRSTTFIIIAVITKVFVRIIVDCALCLESQYLPVLNCFKWQPAAQHSTAQDMAASHCKLQTVSSVQILFFIEEEIRLKKRAF